MTSTLPRALGVAPGRAVIRSQPQDFQVAEQLGFELSGEGEHVFLYLQKCQLNSLELVRRLSEVSGVAERDIGYCGLKDRNAVTRQWFSVGMAGAPEPDWVSLERDGHVRVLDVARHSRKLRRGVHKANRFRLVLRQLQGQRVELEQRLQQLGSCGAPNYFGEQRFGRNGATLEQALRWMHSGRRVTRNKRSLFYSALRASVFNQLLAARVEAGSWNRVQPGDICMLAGSRSFFHSAAVDETIERRAQQGDLHPGLPLWGRFEPGAGPLECPSECREICDFLEQSGVDLSWRATRLLPDDFCWQFCDDGTLQLEFALGAGAYATALLAEFVQYKEGTTESGISSEQG